MAWSTALDRLLPHEISVDAKEYFDHAYLKQLITPGTLVYDVGGGRYPAITREQKARQSLSIVGLDVNADELDAAPHGIYDETRVADITNYQGSGDADFIVTQTVLEHVPDMGRAFNAFQTILKPGGLALVFVPSRNAAFARLNLLLSESLKRRILFFVYPGSRKAGSGWPAYYDRCTPSGFRKLAKLHGFDVLDLKAFYYSSYFKFCFPLYAVWRAWIILGRALVPEAAAETFCVCLKKQTT